MTAAAIPANTQYGISSRMKAFNKALKAENYFTINYSNKNWNSLANYLAEKLYKNFGVVIQPFTDIRFKRALKARNAKRKELQKEPTKRESISKPLTVEEFHLLCLQYQLSDPFGLMLQLFLIFAFELTWQGNEGAKVKYSYFEIKMDNFRRETGRLIYNNVISKTAKGGAQNLESDMWLVKNEQNTEFCAVRIFKLMASHRPVGAPDRLFLNPHRRWRLGTNLPWFCGTPVRRNTRSKWTADSTAAKNVGLTGQRFTNNSAGDCTG